jgi:hypothetical protein
VCISHSSKAGIYAEVLMECEFTCIINIQKYNMHGHRKAERDECLCMGGESNPGIGFTAVAHSFLARKYVSKNALPLSGIFTQNESAVNIPYF